MRHEEFLSIPVVTLDIRDIEAVYEELGEIIVRNYSELLRGVRQPKGNPMTDEDPQWIPDVAHHLWANQDRLARFRYAATTKAGSIEGNDWRELQRRVDPRDVVRLSLVVGDSRTEAEVTLALVGANAHSYVRIRSRSEEDLHRYRGFFVDLFRRRRDHLREFLTTGIPGAIWKAAVGVVPALAASTALLTPIDTADLLLVLVVAGAAGLASWVGLGRLLDQAAPGVIIEGWGPSPRPREYLVDFSVSVLAGAALALLISVVWGS